MESPRGAHKHTTNLYRIGDSFDSLLYLRPKVFADLGSKLFFMLS